MHGGVVDGDDLRARNFDKTRLALGLTHSGGLRRYSVRGAGATNHVNALAERVVRRFLGRCARIVVLLLGGEWLLGHGARSLLFYERVACCLLLGAAGRLEHLLIRGACRPGNGSLHVLRFV